ncbi:sulfite exporter TauE/SafE family protein [Rhizobium sp. CECT 9324]|uniref:sulfite exporter TauE/SafE family protein n=1 Tax=Rhizobium sp. CECT 9324 TaxID=2845820 RepID=UPI001E5F22EB|nr:sulfite exporter TauE/SafE family protein [Rhizobium sp. CECT 9324]CAH0342461.1 hypothetical protein RHI9324_04184 [Rhizobium sp. CECT 9324]
MIEHTSLIVTIALVCAFLVGLSKGGLPSVGTLAVPLLALVISPVTAAALLLPIYIASDMVGLYLYRRSYSGRNLAILVPASLLGVAIGWMFSAYLSSIFIGMIVGMVGVMFCLNAWLGARYRKVAKEADVPAGMFWGTLTGLTSFVSHSGGPPYQMYVLPQRLEKMTFAGTSTILFAIINAAKVIPYWELQQFSNFDSTLVLWLMPAAIIGTVVGKRLTQVLPESLFFRIVEIGLLFLSLKLIADFVFSI